MKNKGLIIGLVIVAAVIALFLIVRTAASKPKAKKAVPGVQAGKEAAKAPAKKVISKGKGALTVRMLNSKTAEVPIRVKAFRVTDQNSSVYAASTVGGRMQEVAPGSYDIEVDTVPQKIFKNIKVEQGKETVEDLGCVTGSMIIKTTNAKKAASYYPIRILYPKTNDMVTAYMTNKAIEIIPGMYDIEIGVSPRLYKKDVKVEAGRETITDMGCVAGSILVKTVDENKNNVRVNVRITRSDTNEIVSSGLSNKPVELGKGSYNIELLSNPKQAKKDVKVELGEEAAVEFTVSAPQSPQKNILEAPKPPVPARPRVIKAHPATAAPLPAKSKQ